MDVPANQAPPRVNTVESALRLCLRALEGFTADCLSAIHQVDVATMDRGGSVQTMFVIGGFRSTAAVDKRPWLTGENNPLISVRCMTLVYFMCMQCACTTETTYYDVMFSLYLTMPFQQASQMLVCQMVPSMSIN